MQTRPEVSSANCGMCAVECRDTSSGPAIPEWSCEKKRRLLTLPRAPQPEVRPYRQVLREIELAVKFASHPGVVYPLKWMDPLCRRNFASSARSQHLVSL